LLAYLKQQGLTILIANRDLINYEEENFNSTDYNYWVADQTGYRLQVLVYHQEHGRVLFRRNKKISWPTESFLLNVDHWRITNPLVSYAFKVTNLDPFQKDMHDIDRLFSAVSKNVS
jgi:hypothetical protein